MAREVEFPEAVLLVDRPALVELFATSEEVSSGRLAVVCIDGSPSSTVDWLRRGIGAGRRAPVLYVHDAATVIYPFAVEPVASMLEQGGAEALAYVDLGLPPLGATARRFGDPTLPRDAVLRELAAIPPATLVRYCTESARRLAPSDGGDRRRARSR
jgi:hypothetical protein